MLYAFFWVIPQCLNFICQHFGTLCPVHLHRRVGMGILHTYPPLKIEQTQCSETLTYKIQTLENYPEESIQQDVVCFNFCGNEILVWGMWEYFICSFQPVLAEMVEHLLSCAFKLLVLPGCHFSYLATL
jgi:hypothetical protein